MKLAEILNNKKNKNFDQRAMKRNREEILISLKIMRITLYSSTIVEHNDITLAFYQAIKKQKRVSAVLITLFCKNGRQS